jgi:hypothetical protein
LREPHSIYPADRITAKLIAAASIRVRDLGNCPWQKFAATGFDPAAQELIDGIPCAC